MGGSIASALSRMFSGMKDQRILMLGLDAAGKSTVLYKMHLGEVLATIPTIGFNVETVEYKNIKFTMWDVGGQDKIRPLWRHYYIGTDALIWAVDSTDRTRMAESKEEMLEVLNSEDLREAKVLVYANKQDLPTALSVKEVAGELELHKLKNTWHIQGSAAVNGDGLFEGLDSLTTMLKAKN